MEIKLCSKNYSSFTLNDTLIGQIISTAINNWQFYHHFLWYWSSTFPSAAGRDIPVVSEHNVGTRSPGTSSWLAPKINVLQHYPFAGTCLAAVELHGHLRSTSPFWGGRTNSNGGVPLWPKLGLLACPVLILTPCVVPISFAPCMNTSETWSSPLFSPKLPMLRPRRVHCIRGEKGFRFKGIWRRWQTWFHGPVHRLCLSLQSGSTRWRWIYNHPLEHRWRRSTSTGPSRCIYAPPGSFLVTCRDDSIGYKDVLCSGDMNAIGVGAVSWRRYL